MPATTVLVYIRTAFALVVRAPLVPNGAAFGASVTTPDTTASDGTKSAGFAVRHLMDYDSGVLADRWIVLTFYKVAPLPLAVDTNGTVTLVPNGGAVRFTA